MKATLFHRSVHLQDQSLLELQPSCPFCASTNRLRIAELQKNPEVLLLHCHDCHASSASRMPTTEALGQYYSHYYDDKKEKITLDMPDRMACHIFRHTKQVADHNKGREVSMLDYGGGDGSISILLAQKFLESGSKAVTITLIDYDKTPVKAPDDRISIARVDSLSETSCMSMDLVIASAVIEHIPQPKEVLIDLLSRLKLGGVFYARTPYVEPLSKVAGLLGARFDFTFPAHVHDLGPRFWNSILRLIDHEGQFCILRSTPSIVETSFRQHFFRTLMAHLLKAPGYLFKESYRFVGGWEIFIQRQN